MPTEAGRNTPYTWVPPDRGTNRLRVGEFGWRALTPYRPLAPASHLADAIASPHPGWAR